jgi:hypothetical protein
MAVSQVEVVGPASGGNVPVDWLHLQAEAVEWDQILTYALIAFGTVLLLFVVATFALALVRR